MASLRTFISATKGSWVSPPPVPMRHGVYCLGYYGMLMVLLFSGGLMDLLLVAGLASSC